MSTHSSLSIPHPLVLQAPRTTSVEVYANDRPTPIRCPRPQTSNTQLRRLTDSLNVIQHFTLYHSLSQVDYVLLDISCMSPLLFLLFLLSISSLLSSPLQWPFCPIDTSLIPSIFFRALQYRALHVLHEWRWLAAWPRQRRARHTQSWWLMELSTHGTAPVNTIPTHRKSTSLLPSPPSISRLSLLEDTGFFRAWWDLSRGISGDRSRSRTLLTNSQLASFKYRHQTREGHMEDSLPTLTQDVRDVSHLYPTYSLSTTSWLN